MGDSNTGDDDQKHERARLFRAALAPSSLDLTAEAVSVASPDNRELYVEFSRNGWRWSVVSRGGPYPLLRLTAAFLRRDYQTLIVGAQGVGASVSVIAPEAPVDDPGWAILEFEGPVSQARAHDLIVNALRGDIGRRLLDAGHRQGVDEGTTFGEMVIDDDTSIEEALRYLTALETNDPTLLAGLSRLTMNEWEALPTIDEELFWAMEAAKLPEETTEVLIDDVTEEFIEAYTTGWDEGMREAVLRAARVKVSATPAEGPEHGPPVNVSKPIAVPYNIDENQAKVDWSVTMAGGRLVDHAEQKDPEGEPLIPASDLLRPETTQFQCPECGKGCAIGVRAPEGEVFVCHEHGSFYRVDKRGRVRKGVRPSGATEIWQRRRLLDLASRVFLGDGFEGNFLIAQSSTLPCNYVMARALDGRIRVEVCSREWGCEHCADHPLGADARRQLSEMGFTTPGPRENPEKWVQPQTPADLGDLLDRCLVVAYDEAPDVELTTFLARAADIGSLVESLGLPRGRP